jgi:hypothetical protein
MSRPPSDDDHFAVPSTIRCLECGGTAHLIDFAPESGFQPGDIVAYRCEDCLERWDVEL